MCFKCFIYLICEMCFVCFNYLICEMCFICFNYLICEMCFKIEIQRAKPEAKQASQIRQKFYFPTLPFQRSLPVTLTTKEGVASI